MSTKPLTFLYPIFYRSVRTSQQQPSHSSKTSRSHPAQTAAPFTTSTRRREAIPQRYGTAQEPQPHLGGHRPALKEETGASKPSEKAAELKATNEGAPQNESKDEQPGEAPGEVKKSNGGPKADRLDASETMPSTPTPEAPRVGQSQPLETVLAMPSPAEEEKKKPPHLQAPPYVHHFDTYGLVMDLTRSGFKQAQAVTIMKAVRGILTDNMELARHALVSKSNVENETYLFRAACSELRTEIANNRNSETEKMRTARTHLQHEVDILNQRVTQESLTLKDDLKGMFDDRKMAVRTEQRNMERQLQELNYKITVALNSDARSEVEGLRWVLTRRAAITLGISATMILGTLQYSSYTKQGQKKLKARAKGEDAAGSSHGGHGSAEANVLPKAHVRGAEGGDELLVVEGVVPLG